MTKPDEGHKAALLRMVDVVDGPPIEAEKVLSDDQLGDGGLIPVRAWMRTKPSANALRQARKKEKAEIEAGKRQLNVVAPADALSREALRAVAVALSDGRISAHDLSIVTAQQVTPLVGDEARMLGLRVLDLRGWRRSLVLWFLRA